MLPKNTATIVMAEVKIKTYPKLKMIQYCRDKLGVLVGGMGE